MSTGIRQFHNGEPLNVPTVKTANSVSMSDGRTVEEAVNDAQNKIIYKDINLATGVSISGGGATYGYDIPAQDGYDIIGVTQRVSGTGYASIMMSVRNDLRRVYFMNIVSATYTIDLGVRLILMKK